MTQSVYGIATPAARAQDIRRGALNDVIWIGALFLPVSFTCRDAEIPPAYPGFGRLIGAVPHLNARWAHPSLGRAAEGTDGGHPLTVERYPRMKPSISSDAQAIAWSMLWPCWVQRAIILVIVACEYIWVAMFVGAGAQEIEAVRSSRGG
jgi:hypothetical protein